MAKSWSGFLPQNQSIKEQWLVLEASQAELEQMLERMHTEEQEDESNPEEDEDEALRRALKIM